MIGTIQALPTPTARPTEARTDANHSGTALPNTSGHGNTPNHQHISDLQHTSDLQRTPDLQHAPDHIGIPHVPDILIRDRAGEPVSPDEPGYEAIASIIGTTKRLCAELNTGWHEPEEAHELFERIVGHPVDPSFRFNPPFYTDFGHNITIGRNVFINWGRTLMDRGASPSAMIRSSARTCSSSPSTISRTPTVAPPRYAGQSPSANACG